MSKKSDNIFRRIDVKKLILLALLFLLIAAFCPSFARFILFLVLLGLFIYLLTKSYPDIVTMVKRLFINQTTRTIRKYIQHDVVEVKPLLVEVGKGKTLIKLGSHWIRILEIEDELPDSIMRILERDEHVVVVKSRDQNYIIIRGEDVDEVDDKSRAIENMLDKIGITYRLLSSEEAINTILNLFRI